jgi:hypothetical protein
VLVSRHSVDPFITNDIPNVETAFFILGIDRGGLLATIPRVPVLRGSVVFGIAPYIACIAFWTSNTVICHVAK